MRLEALLALLVLVTWVAFWGVLSNDFVNYDDDLYILKNATVRQGLSPRSVAWAFTTTEVANWHPVTWLSHMADVQLFGLNAGRHHGVNLLFHTLNSALLLLLLLRMTGALWRSALVAFLFALHPLHVESVAWVSERKDVLSTLFWLLTLAAWLGFIRSRKPALYGASLLLYALGLMAKPMLVTLPFTLLLLDYWPLGRLTFPKVEGGRSLRALLAEKGPFFALAAASCVVTFAAQRSGGTVASVDAVSLWARLTNAIWAYGAYLVKAVWPTSLAVIYPFPRAGHPPFQVGLAAIAVLATTAGCLLVRKKAPFLAFGWLWFLGTLVPVIGIVQVGLQSMADRYTYVPFIGLFIAVAWGLGALVGERRNLRVAAGALCTIVLLLLLAVTRVQVSYWADGVTLFERTLAVTSDNYIIQNNLGSDLAHMGKAEEAIDHFREAIRIKPDYWQAHDNLGAALLKVGKREEAMEHIRAAVQNRPNSPNALVNLGNALVGAGQYAAAETHFRQAIQIKPEFSDAHYNLGVALAAQGRFADACQELRTAVRLDPQNADAHYWLGRALAASGQAGDALGPFQEAVRLKPDFAPWRNDLGKVLQSLNRLEEAAVQYQEAIRLKPEFAEAHNNLGLVLAAVGRVPEAETQFRLALQIRPAYADAHNNLGIALAAENRGPEAREQFMEALRVQPDFAKARANLLRVEAELKGGPPP